MRHGILLWMLVVALLGTSCAASAPSAGSGTSSGMQRAQGEGRRGGVLTVAVSGNVHSMGQLGIASTSTGGWFALSEVHSAALITSDVHSRRPVARLLDRVPSFENGDITLLPDGRMQVAYRVRSDVKWHDGERFDARDLVFSYRLVTDPGLPFLQSDVTRMMGSAEAPDDATFLVTYSGPFYRADQIGLRLFWPYARHLLEPAFERYLENRNADEVINQPYWTSGYVNLGPFRLTAFDPSGPIELQAFDGYFLGRPKLDMIRVRIFTDMNVVYTNLQAGTVDYVPETVLPPELGFDLMDHWKGTGEGTVYMRKSAMRFLSPQERAEVQPEPAMFEVPIRAALYRGLDREALSEGLQGGRADLAGWGLLWEGEPLFESTKDSLRPFAYDPQRAQTMLRESGWVPGSDGALRNGGDGRRLRTSISSTAGRIEREVHAFADYWRRLGVDVEQIVVPASQTRNAEARALYPGWEASASGGGDEVLGRLEGPAGSPANRWTGNRGGYEDPRAQELLRQYRSSLRFEDQLRSFKALSDFVVETLPMLILFATAEPLSIRKGIRALDDLNGGDSAGRPYGTYARNSHLWELE
jgi:ABC-type transport system substrate-binding protein